MENYDRYDLAITVFSFSEKEGAKIRPVAILTAASFHRHHDSVICAMVTTASQTKWASDVALVDYTRAGLRTPSVVRLKIFTLQKDRLAGRIGALSDWNRRSVGAALRRVLVECENEGERGNDGEGP